MGNNLIIGDSSQLSHYFPSNYDKISSRNINYKNIREQNYDRIFLLFAEQRTFLNETELFYNSINVDYTLEVIDNLKDYCNKIVIYSTSELWNNCQGKVSINYDHNYFYSPYVKSKKILCDIINNNRIKYKNVIIVYPFNFNTPYRQKGFLFEKIFDSLINKKINRVGNINFYRDMIHPSIIVNNSITTDTDILIGSGELINLKHFIQNLFDINGMDFEKYIIDDMDYQNHRKEYYCDIKYSNYNELLNLTNNDVRKNFPS